MRELSVRNFQNLYISRWLRAPSNTRGARRRLSRAYGTETIESDRDYSDKVFSQVAASGNQTEDHIHAAVDRAAAPCERMINDMAV